MIQIVGVFLLLAAYGVIFAIPDLQDWARYEQHIDELIQRGVLRRM